MMIIKRVNRTSHCMSSLMMRFSESYHSSSNVVTTFKLMIQNQNFQDVADQFKKLSISGNQQSQDLFSFIFNEAYENRMKWDAGIIVDISNTISMTKHAIAAEKFYPALYERFNDLNEDSQVKLLHLLTKIPEKEKRLHNIYYQRFVPLISNLKNNPKSFSVALIAFLHLYDSYSEAQINCICKMVNYYKWSLVPKHAVNILTYAKPPLQNLLMEILMENITFYAKYDLLITK